MKLVIRKSKPAKSKVQSTDDNKLEYFRKLILDHLDTLESGAMEKGAKMPIGTIREWKGKKYIKVGPNKWRPKYDNESRGAKMAVAAIRRKVAAAKDAHEMMQIILENRDRFSDKDGHPLPFVQELSVYVRDKSDAVESAANTKKGEEKKPSYDELDQAIATMGGSNAHRKGDSIIITEIGKEKRQPVKSDIDRLKRENQNLNIEYKNGEIIITKKGKGEKVKSKEKPQKQKKESEEEKKPSKFEKIPIGKVEQWLVDEAKEVGLDIAGFEHEITNEFVSHVMNRHGDEKKEAKQGQIAITEADFKKIPDIVKAPDYVMVGAKSKGLDVLVYSKKQEDGTTIYFEEVLDSKKNKSLRGKTMYKWKGEAKKENLKSVVANNGKTDISKAKIISLEADGGNPAGAATTKESLVVANPTETQGSPKVSSESGEKSSEEQKNGETKRRFSLEELNDGWKDGVFSMKEVADNLDDGDIFQGFSAETWKTASSNEEDYRAGKITAKELDKKQEKLFSEENRVEESEEEKQRNRSEAMKGNKNAYKGGPKPQPETDRKDEEEDVKKARARAGMPPVEKHGRSSAMKDSTWDPKSKDYRYRDTGYIAGSRKELAQSYIRSMAKSGTQVTNESIDWTGIEENDVAAAEIITKQNLMGKPDWEALQAGGLNGGAGYLINEIFKTINSKPERATADNRYNFSRGLDAIRSRLEACKTLDEVKTVAKDIQGEITGDYLSSKKTPEYLALVDKKATLEKKIQSYQTKMKEKVYEQGDPFAEAREYFNKNMGIAYKIDRLIDPVTGEWNGMVWNQNRSRQYEILKKCQSLFKRRQAEIEERTGIKLENMASESRDIYFQMRDVAEAKNKELELTNTMKSAWETFGKSFQKAVKVIVNSDTNPDGTVRFNRGLGGESFAKHMTKASETGSDDFSWAEKKAAGGKGGPRKTQFELKVADRIVRKGGREVKAESTEELKNMFNLRDVQSGNWVLNDPKSAKFHVDNIAMGLSDLADITGIPDDLISLNGRLAIAIGARGHSNFLAHYEPVERVINITKMKGGGSLGHEWWHAFDNLIADAMTGGRYNIFLSENGRYNDLTSRQRKLLDRVLMYKRWMESSNGDRYKNDYDDAKAAAKKAGVMVDEIEASETHVAMVKSAFENLANAMMTGTATRTEDIYYTKDDYAYINSSEGKSMLSQLGVTKDAMDFDEALEKAGRYRLIYGKKPPQIKRLIAAYYDDDPNGGGKSAKTKGVTSHFFENAKRLEGGSGKRYWSSITEMGARAFSAYLNDKMADREWENNYLAHATDNSVYDSHSPYPAGDERKTINEAFDGLFKAINETGAIRKAISRENAERISPKNAGIIEKAIDGALRIFTGLQNERDSFRREEVALDSAVREQEAYLLTVEDEPKVAGRFITEDELRRLAQEQPQKTIAIDFDGVINSYTSGWQGPTETDEPVLSAAESISSLFDRGYKLIIFSTRANTSEGAETIREYLRNHTNDVLADSIEITDRKPIADIYIDDRAIPFTGNWGETLERIEAFEPWVGKSLTYSGYPLQGRAKVQGMDISIENKKGSNRSGTDKDGHEWSVKMHFDYGYIRGTVGVDKDHLDCYVGPNPESEIVYIVNQNDPVTGDFDEQKVMLGFNSEVEAKAAYLKQYDRPGFLGSILKMDIDTFKEIAFAKKSKGIPLIKSARSANIIGRIRSLNDKEGVA